MRSWWVCLALVFGMTCLFLVACTEKEVSPPAQQPPTEVVATPASEEKVKQQPSFPQELTYDGPVVSASFANNDVSLRFDFGYGTMYNSVGGMAYISDSGRAELYHMSPYDQSVIQLGKGKLSFKFQKWSEGDIYLFSGELTDARLTGTLKEIKSGKTSSVQLNKIPGSCSLAFAFRQFGEKGENPACKKYDRTCEMRVGLFYPEPTDQAVADKNYRPVLTALVKDLVLDEKAAQKKKYETPQAVLQQHLSDALKELEEEAKDNTGPTERYSDVYVSVQSCTSKIISIRESALRYQGGASTGEDAIALTYDLASAKRLTLRDIQKPKQDLSAAIKEYVKKHFPDGNALSDLEDINKDSFSLLPYGIVFESGSQATAHEPGLTFFIPYAALTDKIKKEYLPMP